MGFLDDQRLAQQIRSGDEQAFVTLIRRYERSLTALIRDRIGAVDVVEDVLQETLVHAWSGLRDRSPRHVRAWLYQVARNRCADYLRSAQRREQFVDPEELATILNRFGVPAVRQRRSPNGPRPRVSSPGTSRRRSRRRSDSIRPRRAGPSAAGARRRPGVWRPAGKRRTRGRPACAAPRPAGRGSRRGAPEAPPFPG